MRNDGEKLLSSCFEIELVGVAGQKSGDERRLLSYTAPLPLVTQNSSQYGLSASGHNRKLAASKQTLLAAAKVLQASLFLERKCDQLVRDNEE